jgi:hypothetical protein
MRPWVALTVLIFLATAFVPLAQAHQCSGTDCGPCVKGETHQHADAQGSCQSGPGFYQDAGYGGASQSVPAAGVAGLVAALGVALAVTARR